MSATITRHRNIVGGAGCGRGLSINALEDFARVKHVMAKTD
ncbi:MAG TPA: hypothetical protein VH306_08865 [Gaiellaceae bacterium]|jgi:hypothetical protein